MPDREKIIEGVEHCLGYGDNGADCLTCPYTDDCGTDAVPLFHDILALLKAQTPRLLTEDDFQREDTDRGGAIPCWKEPKSPTRREGWAVIVYGKWLADKGTARYWTGKPSEKQKREATLWI